jgi:hypothetical protein
LIFVLGSNNVVEFGSNNDVEFESPEQQDTPILMRIVKDVRSVFAGQSDTLTNTSMKNARQIQMLSENKTIWHAVSAFSKEEGKTSWNLAKLVKSMTENMTLDPPGWVTGKDRGVFGETPLHIALLWNKQDTVDLTKFFHELWDMCPRLRTAQYTDPLYKGENVLHIAIVKKADAAIIRRIVESEEWPVLREHRAVGHFFKHKQKSDGACNILGEHVLSFAACTNQRSLFRYMVSKGASLRITTSEGNGLLHLMVLNAFDGEDGPGGAGRDSGPAAPAASAGGGCSDGRPEILDVYKRMYDEIERCMGEQGQGTLEAMRKHENHEGYTPLKLAAAVGSLAMFNHLFDKEVEVAWIFGPVVCRKLYLKGIDVPLRRDGVAQGKAGGRGVPVEDEGGGRSVLEVLVDNERKDIIAHSLVDKIVEAKWSRYGRGIFHARLAGAVVFTSLVYLAPMANPAHLSAGCRAAHAAVYILACCCFAPELLGEVDFLRRLVTDALAAPSLGGAAEGGAQGAGTPKDATAAAAQGSAAEGVALGAETTKDALAPAATEQRARRAELYSQARSKLYRLDIESLFALLATPILVILTIINLTKKGLPAAPGPCWCWCPPTVCNATQGAPAAGAPALAAGAPAAAAEASMLRDAEKSLYASLSVLSFLRLLYLGMGFEDYGAFILMIVRITRKDLPVFMAIYTVFLLGVGHLHYFASNELHAGVLQGMDSVWRIFSAGTACARPRFRAHVRDAIESGSRAVAAAPLLRVAEARPRPDTTRLGGGDIGSPRVRALGGGGGGARRGSPRRRNPLPQPPPTAGRRTWTQSRSAPPSHPSHRPPRCPPSAPRQEISLRRTSSRAQTARCAPPLRPSR